MNDYGQSRPFLSYVAEDLIKRFGNNLVETTLVFPGRRVRLFFNNYLYQYAGAPVWAPQYVTIDELFSQVSPFQQADEIQLICELYSAYIEVYNSKSTNPSTETLDDFFFFGEILLNDFDDIDKNLVNVRSLFGNLKDLDQLKDHFSHLSESQVETLTRYLIQTFQEETSLKSAFWSVWNILGEVYALFKDRLKKKKMAYPGMMMREVIENENIHFDNNKYAFVGFNVLSKCEEKLFHLLHDKALFYWDVDAYYYNRLKEATNEAGRFISQNIRKFGSALDLDSFDNFRSPSKKITVIASPSESAQSAFIPSWIESLNRPEEFMDPDSAIVLCNEGILNTVMHAIPPEKVKNVNITMGFPITQSPVCSFLQVLTEMQVKGVVDSGKSFRYLYVLPVLRHPYTYMIFPEAKEVEKTLIKGNVFFPKQEILKDKGIFSYAHSAGELAGYLLELIERVGKEYKDEGEFTDIYAGLYQESIFRAYQVVSRLYGLLITNELNIRKVTFLRLMKKILSSTSIPFHGEPVKGLQVMGVLETRTLDFKNLLLMSTNEGFMPGTNSDNTFIPQFIRKYFGLSTIEHQDSVYAYYFYRLLQRAENITLVYNTDKTQTSKSEMSRFILQLLMDSGLHINRYSLQSSVKPLQAVPVEIKKNGEVIEKIRHLYDYNTNPDARILSPSALNTYVDCPLKFYLRYIEGLKPEEELSDEFDDSVFGIIFHKAAEMLYRKIGRIENQKDFLPFLVKKEQLDLFLKNPSWMDQLVVNAISKEYFRGKEVDPKQYGGKLLINYRVIRHMLKLLVEFDRQQTPFYILGLEKNVSETFTLKGDFISLKIGGVIDRLQEKDSVLNIIDYKTGGTAKSYKTIEDLVTQKDSRPSHIFQAFIYAVVLIKNGVEQDIIPSLIYMRDAGKKGYSPVITYEKEAITDFRPYAGVFEKIFMDKISEIFKTDVPFSQTVAKTKCVYCDFKELCNR